MLCSRIPAALDLCILYHEICFPHYLHTNMSLYVPEINFCCVVDHQYEMHDNACVNYLPPTILYVPHCFDNIYEEK
jgi:hypothetical protein